MAQAMDQGQRAAPVPMNARITKKMLQALAPLPDTAMRLLSLLDDPNVPLREIADIAVRDIGISATMLRMANSAMFGLRGRVGSISDAIRVIGTAQARLLVLASGVSQAAQKELPLYGLAAGSFLRHSELVGNVTMYVAREVGYPSIGSAYSAGLLHDIGKIVINGVAQQDSIYAHTTLEAIIGRHGCALPDAERIVCGNTHADVGRQLAELWSLPHELIEALTLHHEALMPSPENMLACCVAIANVAACEVDPTYPAFNRAGPLPEPCPVNIDAVCAIAEQYIGENARSA